MKKKYSVPLLDVCIFKSKGEEVLTASQEAEKDDVVGFEFDWI